MFKAICLAILGYGLILCGGLLVTWIGYNLFISPQPEFVESTNGSTRSGFRGLGFGAMLIVIGFSLIFSQSSSKQDTQDAETLEPSLPSEQPGEGGRPWF